MGDLWPPRLDHGACPARHHYSARPARLHYSARPARLHYSARPARLHYSAHPARLHYSARPARLHYSACPHRVHYSARPARLHHGACPACFHHCGDRTGPGLLRSGRLLAKMVALWSHRMRTVVTRTVVGTGRDRSDRSRKNRTGRAQSSYLPPPPTKRRPPGNQATRKSGNRPRVRGGTVKTRPA